MFDTALNGYGLIILYIMNYMSKHLCSQDSVAEAVHYLTCVNSLVLTTILGSRYLHPILQMRRLRYYCEVEGHKARKDQYSKPSSLTPESVLFAIMYTASLWFINTRVEVQESSGRAHAKLSKGCRVRIERRLLKGRKQFLVFTLQESLL